MGYTFGDEIGTGKFAVTRHVTHKISGDKYAAKVIKYDSDSLKFAIREYDFMKEFDMSHPGLCPLHEAYICRKYMILILPIASMDAMEDMDILTGSNPVINNGPQHHPFIPGSEAVSSKLGLGTSTAPGLRYRHLGKSGLKVSNIGLGSLKAFSSDDCELNEKLVSLAFDSGINFFDISEPYSSKRAEVELGRIIKKRGWNRRQYAVCTKVYWDKTEGKALSRKEIIESVRDSLENLQLEYI